MKLIYIAWLQDPIDVLEVDRAHTHVNPPLADRCLHSEVAVVVLVLQAMLRAEPDQRFDGLPLPLFIGDGYGKEDVLPRC